MKFKCEQCGTVYENGTSCPVCGAEAEAPAVLHAERKPLNDVDQERFWQETKYEGGKTESDR